MFKDNRYTKIYHAICHRAQQRVLDGYEEKHHIVPRSLGGSNRKSNIVSLTAREHYICHLLLIRITEGPALHKMLLAVRRFNLKDKDGREFHRNSRLYESLRKKANESFKGYKHSPEALEKIRQARLKQGISESTKAKIGQANKGKVRSEEFKENLRALYKGKKRNKDKTWV